MIKAKHQIITNKDISLYYYCDHLKDCIDRNKVINQTREKLKRKKLENIKLKDIKD